MLRRYSLIKPLRVLLVEGEPSQTAALERYLTDFSQPHIELVKAANLAQCFELFDDKFHLVILNLALAEDFGLQTYRQFKDKLPFVPLIVLLADAEQELACEVLTRGTDDFLVIKEISKNTLLRSISVVLERRRAVEEQDLLISIVDSSRDAIVGQALTGEIVSWNKGAERIYGFHANEVVGRRMDDFSESGRALIESYLGRIAAGESVPTFESRLWRKNGEEIICSFNANPIRNCDGIITGVSVVSREITHERTDQLKAEQAAANLRIALEAAQMGIWNYADKTYDLDDRCYEMFGLEKETFDRTFRSFMHCVSERDRERVYFRAQGSLEAGEEFQIVLPDGTVRDIFAKGREYILGDGQRAWAGICMDVSERRHAQRETALLKLLLQREEFMATLTHDLKNPLLATKRLLEMLIAGRMGEMSEEQTNVMVQIRDTNSSVLALIKNLLDIYREEQEGFGHRREPCDVKLLIEECISQFEPIAEMRSVEIVPNLPSGAVPMLADANGIRRILQNLLDNAIKFSDVDGKIDVKLVRSDHEVIIEIEDDGRGIPPAEQERLFQRFSQGSEGRKYTDGSGLGLYLCKRLVEAHGGTIGYVGQVNEGAKFRVSLPLALRKAVSGEFKHLV